MTRTRAPPTETKAWEVDTLRGHTNNVSCVMFHARQVGGCGRSRTPCEGTVLSFGC